MSRKYKCFRIPRGLRLVRRDNSYVVIKIKPELHEKKKE